jgi:flagellar hook-associated protein 1 FlgK
MPDILSISSSGISAAQSAINITSQNISNVSTVGYVREEVNQSSSETGEGTQVVDIARVYNQFLTKQVTQSATMSAFSSVQDSQIQPLNSILADSSSGISPAISNFFNALQEVSAQPADIAPRQSFMGQAQTLVSVVGRVQGTIDSINTDINSQMEQSVSNVNSYASQILALNKAIAGTTDASSLNSLQDQRNVIVHSLSQEINVKVQVQNNQYVVSIGAGLPLVAPENVYPLSVKNADTNNKEEIIFSKFSGAVFSSGSLAGGTIGGLIDFRSKILNPASNSLGLVVVGLTKQINYAQTQGSSLQSTTSTPGVALFKDLNPSVYANNKNASSVIPTASFDVDPANPNAFLANLKASDYTVSYDGTNYNMLRLSDNQIVATQLAGSPASAQDLIADGLKIHIPTGLQNGDSFRINPTGDAARQFELATTDPQAIAAATGGPTAPVLVSSGDNSNMKNLIAVQNNSILNGGLNTVSGSFNQFVSTIGSQAHDLQVRSAFDETVYQKANESLENVSGVNLDEEASNLIRFQRAYEASGKVMQVAKQLFDGLLGSLQ